jgi:hypothetical protein
MNPTLSSDPTDYIGGLLLQDGQSLFNTDVLGPQAANIAGINAQNQAQASAIASQPWVTLGLYAIIAWIVISIFAK